MKQEIFKSMYNKISLSEEQKNGIYQEIEAAAEEEKAVKKVRFTARAAAFAVIFLLSGMTVFAVGKLSLEDRFAEALHPRHEHNLTADQKGFYEKYGNVLDNVIETYYGTLKLEAALYDDYYLIVPYTYDMNIKEGENREKYSGVSLDNIYYYTEVDTEHVDLPLGYCRYGDSAELGVDVGSYIFHAEDDEEFEQGEVIKLYTARSALKGKDKFLTEFTLGTKVDRVNLTIAESTRKEFEENGIMIEEISVSPISIHYSGISYYKSIYTKLSVVLKDGSEIGYYSGGERYYDRKEGKLLDEYPYLIDYTRVFTSPINFEDVEGIRIKTGKTHIWIPMEYED